jgi:sugar phosphate permease
MVPASTSAFSKEDRNLPKRWWYLLPAVFITYSLAYLDRANYGLGAAAGLARSLHITEKQNSLLAALFFLGYFISQVPGAAVARKHSPTRVIFLSLIIWGALASLTGTVHQFGLLAMDRFLLGVAESIVFPAMLFLLTQWFTRTERSRANTFLILGNPLTVLWMSAITGYLIKILGWQKTFILEGVPAMCWAIVWILIAADRPSKARWATPEAADLLEKQLALEQLTIAPVEAVRKALLRRDVLLLSFQYFCWSLGVYGFVLWLPTIVRQSGALSIEMTGLLSAIPYLAAIVLMLRVSHISDKTLKRESLVWPLLLTAGLALLGSFALAHRSFVFGFVSLVVAGACMYAPYGPFFAIAPERLPSNVTAEVLALINSFGALGAFVGSYMVGFLRAVTGDARASYLLMSISLVCSALLLLKLPATPVDA